MSSPFMTDYGDAAAVTPSDTTQITFRALYIGGAGNVAVVMESGVTVTFTAPPVGSILPVRGIKVNATNTTATLIVALR